VVHVADVMALIEQIAPTSLAEPWDNVGLMFGGQSWPVEHILLAVDPTPAVAAQAEGLAGCMIVTHHPLFFEPIRALVEDDLAGSVVSALSQTHTALVAAHTNLDKSPTHGTALALAETLGLGGGAPGRGVEGIGGGLGCVAVPAEPLHVFELVRLVRERLRPRVVQLIGQLEGAAARRLALVPGAGGGVLAAAAEAGAAVVITGEVKHHQALQASITGPAVITAGHFETERPVLRLLQRHLQERLPGLDIRITEESSPIWSVHTGDSGG
jgi:dinuclear metal center YbgI/SA1388 family protein